MNDGKKATAVVLQTVCHCIPGDPSLTSLSLFAAEAASVAATSDGDDDDHDDVVAAVAVAIVAAVIAAAVEIGAARDGSGSARNPGLATGQRPVAVPKDQPQCQFQNDMPTNINQLL